MRSLVDEIAHSVIQPAAKKSFFSGIHIPFQRYLGCYQEAFEIGVVLGYGFRDRLVTFAKLFSEVGREQELIDFMQKLAQERLEEVGDAKSFLDLAMVAEEMRIELNWNKSGMTPLQVEHLQKHHKMPLDQVFKNIHVAVSIGIGFGSAFPEQTEKMWKLEHEREITPEQWTKWRSAGLDIPEEPEEPVTLFKRQKQLLSHVELFVAKTRPDLLPLFRTPPN